MNDFCLDTDLLCVEPAVFSVGGPPASQLAAGRDGVISATTFTSATANFLAAGVRPGMALVVTTSTVPEGAAYEIVSVPSATTLTISVLRATPSAECVAPPAGGGLAYCARTFAPQIHAVSANLSERLRRWVEVSGVDSAAFADSAQLRGVTVYGVLARIFTARAQNSGDRDANWVKAKHYLDLFAQGQLTLRLAADADGDGFAESVRTLGQCTLRRA